MNQAICPALLDSAASAELIGVGRRTFYNLKKASPGFPKPVEIRPGMPRYKRDELLAWVANLEPTLPARDEPKQLRASAKNAAKPSIVHRIEPRPTKSRKATRTVAEAGA